MAKTLDFNTRKKEYLTVKLNDDKKTVLMIGTPTKAILTEFLAINDELGDDGADQEAIDALYDVCAKVMSFNKGGIKITSDYLATFFDLDDVMVFFNGYTEFMTSVTKSKN
jgi:hypothetical protein